jgi:hypothetical protein
MKKAIIGSVVTMCLGVGIAASAMLAPAQAKAQVWVPVPVPVPVATMCVTPYLSCGLMNVVPVGASCFCPTIGGPVWGFAR